MLKVKFVAFILVVLFFASIVQPITATPNPKYTYIQIISHIFYSKNPDPIPHTYVYIKQNENIRLIAILNVYFKAVIRKKVIGWYHMALGWHYLNFDMYRLNTDGSQGEQVFHNRKMTTLFTGMATTDWFHLDYGIYKLVISYGGNRDQLLPCSIKRKIHILNIDG